MARSRATDLQALIIASAAALPTETGEVATYERRAASAGKGHVVLADVSSSMNESISPGRLKIDVLREALSQVNGARIMAFASAPTMVPSAADLPSPQGTTALHLALDLAANMRPARTLVISDGEPDSKVAALASAHRVPGIIDVIYCGPESNYAARQFLQQLARAGGGRYAAHPLREAPALATTIRALLAR